MFKNLNDSSFVLVITVINYIYIIDNLEEQMIITGCADSDACNYDAEPTTDSKNDLCILKYYEIIEKLTLNKISGDGLAVFRVLYTLVLMCEVGHLIYYYELIFATKPYSSSYQLNFIPALLAWEIVLLLIMVGACTRTMTVINYVFNLVFLY